MSRPLHNVQRALELERTRRRAVFENADRVRFDLEGSLETVDAQLEEAERACTTLDLEIRALCDRRQSVLHVRRQQLQERLQSVIFETVEPAREALIGANVRVRTVELLAQRRRSAEQRAEASSEQRCSDEAAATRSSRSNSKSGPASNPDSL